MSGLTLLALLASGLLGVSDFLGGVLSRRIPLMLVLLVSQVVAAIALSTRLIVEPFDPGASDAILWGVIGGAATAVGVSCLFRGLAIGTMGVVAPITSLRNPVASDESRTERPLFENARCTPAASPAGVSGGVATSTSRAAGPPSGRRRRTSRPSAPVLLARAAALVSSSSSAHTAGCPGPTGRSKDRAPRSSTRSTAPSPSGVSSTESCASRRSRTASASLPDRTA